MRRKLQLYITLHYTLYMSVQVVTKSFCLTVYKKPTGIVNMSENICICPELLELYVTMEQLGIEPATFRSLVRCHNHCTTMSHEWVAG